MSASRREVRAFHAMDEEILTKVAGSLAQDLALGNQYNHAVTDPLTGLKNKFFSVEQLCCRTVSHQKVPSPHVFCFNRRGRP